MRKTLKIASAAALVVATSTAAMAQEIPLNILVSGSTGGEISQGQAGGSLAVTTGSTGLIASVASTLLTSTASSTSTN